VNLASRVVGVAAPDEVIIEGTMAQTLRDEGFTVTSVGERDLKGFGLVGLWRLER
jgi:class 3 adenylate cyclase